MNAAPYVRLADAQRLSPTPGKRDADMTFMIAAAYFVKRAGSI